MTGLPKLGASPMRTLRGMTVSNTSSGKCSRTSRSTSWARRVRPSCMVNSIPATVRHGLSSRWTSGTASVFEKLGAPAPDAGVTAATLIHADLMGIDSHGLNRLPVNSYAGGLQSGDIDAKASPEIVHEEASTAVIDGQNGLGPVAATTAMELAIDKAKKTGAGFVAIRNSNHYGAASHYSTMALPHGMIGFSMTIGGLGVVATGGRGRRLGINPMSVAAPAG